MNRPFSVIAVCVFYGLFGLGVGLGGLMGMRWSGIGDQNYVIAAGAGVFIMVVTVGLWQLKRWASIVGIILGGGMTLLFLFSIFSMRAGTEGTTVFLGLAFIILPALSCAILLNENGKGTFA